MPAVPPKLTETGSLVCALTQHWVRLIAEYLRGGIHKIPWLVSTCRQLSGQVILATLPLHR